MELLFRADVAAAAAAAAGGGGRGRGDITWMRDGRRAARRCYEARPAVRPAFISYDDDARPVVGSSDCCVVVAKATLLRHRSPGRLGRWASLRNECYHFNYADELGK